MADTLNLLWYLLQGCWQVLLVCLLLALTLSPVSRIPRSVRSELAIAYPTVMLAAAFLLPAYFLGTGVRSEFRFYVVLAFGFAFCLARFHVAGTWRSISGWIVFAVYLPFLLAIFSDVCRRRFH